MSLTAQDWQQIELKRKWRAIESEKNWREIEPERNRTKPKKILDPMIYPAVLAIIGMIGLLVTFVYAVRTANEQLSHQQSVHVLYRAWRCPAGCLP